MRKQLIFIVLLGLLFSGILGKAVLSQSKQIKAVAQKPKTVKEFQAEIIRNFKPSLFPETIREVSGMANVNTNPATGEVWSLGMFGTPAGEPVANVGFKSISLQNTSTMDWAGVTITATFEMLKGHGVIMVHAGAEENTGGGWVQCADDQLSANSHGTQNITSKPFTMKAGANYKGTAWLSLEHAYNRSLSSGMPIGCSAKIISIKFNFL